MTTIGHVIRSWQCTSAQSQIKPSGNPEQNLINDYRNVLVKGKASIRGYPYSTESLLTTVTLALHCSKMGTSSRQQFLWPIRYDDIFCAAVESFVSSKEFVRKFLGHVFWDGWFGMSLQTKPIYDFGPFRLNTAEHLLLRAREPVRLPPKSFRVASRSG